VPPADDTPPDGIPPPEEPSDYAWLLGGLLAFFLVLGLLFSWLW